MLDLTVRALTWMLRIWLPDSHGRHRAESIPIPPAPAPHVTAAPRPPDDTNAVTRASTHPHPQTPALALDDRVRRRATRGLRERRRALYLASLGLDAEPPRPPESRFAAAHAGVTR